MPFTDTDQDAVLGLGRDLTDSEIDYVEQNMADTVTSTEPGMFFDFAPEGAFMELREKPAQPDTTGVEPEREGFLGKTAGFLGDVSGAMFPTATQKGEDIMGVPDADINVIPAGQGPLAQYNEANQGLPTLTAEDGQVTYDEQGAPIEETLPTLERTGMSGTERGMEVGLNLASDIGSLGERALGATFNPEEGKSFLQELSNPEASITKELKQALRASGTHPALKMAGEIALSMGSDPGVLTSGLKQVAKGTGKGLGKAYNLAKRDPEASKRLVSEKLSLAQPSKAIARTVEKASGIDEEIIKKWATKEGRADLRKHWDKQDDIGQGFLKFADDFDNRFPEHQKIKDMLPNLPDISTKNAVKALRARKIPDPSGTDIDLNKAIEKYAKSLEKTGTLTAPRFRAKRSRIDKEIGTSWDLPFKSDYANALRAPRKVMMKDLEKAAKESGNPEFVKDMKTYSKKIGTMEDFMKNLPPKESTKPVRIEAVLNQLKGKNKTQQNLQFEEIDKVFNSNFSKALKSAFEAEQIGVKGRKTAQAPYILKGSPIGGGDIFTTTIKTILGSPGFHGELTLPAVNLIEKAISGTAKGIGKSADQYTKYMGMVKLVGELQDQQKKRLAKLSKAYNKNPDNKKIEKEITDIVKSKN